MFASLHAVVSAPMVHLLHFCAMHRLLRESADGQKVLVEVPGAPSANGAVLDRPLWLSVFSDRIWRGSMKGKDWKHLVSRRHVCP
jgi:hypothetical protein